MREYKTPEERLLACLFDPEYKAEMAKMYQGMAAKCARRLERLLLLNAPPFIVAKEVEMIRERLVEWLNWSESDNLEALSLIVNEDWDKVKRELAEN